MRMFKLKCTDTLRTLEDTVYTFTYAFIHSFIYLVIQLGNYNIPGSGDIIVSKLDIVIAFWELESSQKAIGGIINWIYLVIKVSNKH